MNNSKLKQDIEDIEAKLKEMKLELESSSSMFKWEYEECETYCISTAYISDGYYGTDKEKLEYGIYRKTKANAEIALKRNKEANIIEALAEQFGSDGSGGHIIYSTGGGKYKHTGSFLGIAGVPYMSYEIAEQVCEVLNNKGVEI